MYASVLLLSTLNESGALYVIFRKSTDQTKMQYVHSTLGTYTLPSANGGPTYVARSYSILVPCNKGYYVVFSKGSPMGNEEISRDNRAQAYDVFVETADMMFNTDTRSQPMYLRGNRDAGDRRTLGMTHVGTVWYIPDVDFTEYDTD